MAETKDSPPIKLFGMTISLQIRQDSSNPTTEKEKIEMDFDDVKGPINKVKVEEEEKEGEEKIPKPDKILPCPRCNSLETKFCYFNNYNVKQPRHFCKNCQRYWTAGGTMRNVPIGAGRRKNKLLRIIHHATPRGSADSETTHLTPIVNFRGREEDHTTNHAVPIASPFVYPNRIPSNGIIPLQFVPMPCWVWTLGGNRTMQEPMVGFDNMGLDKNGSSRLGKHSRDDFSEEKMMGARAGQNAWIEDTKKN